MSKQRINPTCSNSCGNWKYYKKLCADRTARVCGAGYVVHGDTNTAMCRHQKPTFFGGTVFVRHIKEMPKDEGEYIGRLSSLGDSPLANPFRIGSHGTREVVIQKYEMWLKKMIQGRDPVICKELVRLARMLRTGTDVHLKCFCHPYQCHGDVVKKVIERLSLQPKLMLKILK